MYVIAPSIYEQIQVSEFFYPDNGTSTPPIKGHLVSMFTHTSNCIILYIIYIILYIYNIHTDYIYIQYVLLTHVSYLLICLHLHCISHIGAGAPGFPRHVASQALS